MLTKPLDMHETSIVALEQGQSYKQHTKSPSIVVLHSGAATVHLGNYSVAVVAPEALVLNGSGNLEILADTSIELSHYEAVDTKVSASSNNYVVNVQSVGASATIVRSPIAIGAFGSDYLYFSESNALPKDGISFSLNINKEYILYGSEIEKSPIGEEIFDIVVIGAGPTGLSAAAHGVAEGLKVLVLGEPLSFWKRSILPLPLRSPIPSTDISTPTENLRYIDFVGRHGLKSEGKIDFQNFIAYSQEFLQKQTISILPEYAQNIRKDGGGWKITTSRDTHISTKNLVISAGLESMRNVPSRFQQLTSQYCLHSSEVNSLETFRGQDIIVVGGAQSALELAVELADVANKVYVLIRKHKIMYRSLHSPGNSLFKFLFIYSNRYFRHIPMWLKKSILKFLLLGTAEPDIKESLSKDNIEIIYEAKVVDAIEENDRAMIRLHSGRNIAASRVILGTGYKYDIRKLPFLSGHKGQPIIQHDDGFPILNADMESTEEGLFFTGYPCVRVIGPKAQFIAGTALISPIIVRKAKRRCAI